MEAHPLRGRARWVWLPLACGAAGGLAGLAWSWLASGKVDTLVVAGSALMGFAAGVATAFSRQAWLTVLLSPVSGLLVLAPFVARTYADANVSMSPWQMAQFSFHIVAGLVLVLTAPMTALHAWRLRRGRTRLGVDILAAAIVAVLASSVLPLLYGRFEMPSPEEFGFLATYFAGGLLALEAALRIPASRKG